MVLRKFQHGAVCFLRRLAPLPLPRSPRPAPNGCYLFRLTLPKVRTPGANLHSMLAPPLHHGGVPMVVRDDTRRGETQFRPGACPHVPVHQTHNPPSGLSKPAHCHDLKLALKARVPLLLNALYRTLEWLNDNPPPAPLTPPTGANSWGRPWSPYSTSHTALQRPPPAYQPPPPPPPSRTKWHTSLQSAPVPHPLRHTLKLGNTPASPQDLSGPYR